MATKVYGIYEYHCEGDKGDLIAILSSKTKALDYIESCISDAKTFMAIKTDKPWYEADVCYWKEVALTRKNLLNYRYCGKTDGYYVEQLNIL